MSSCIISLQSGNMISCHSKRNFSWGNPWRFPGINTVKGISNSMPCPGRAIHLVFDFIVLNVDKNVPRMRMRMRTGRARAAVGVVIVQGKNVPSFLWTIHFEGINYAFSFHCAWVVGCQLSPRPAPLPLPRLRPRPRYRPHPHHRPSGRDPPSQMSLPLCSHKSLTRLLCTKTFRALQPSAQENNLQGLSDRLADRQTGRVGSRPSFSTSLFIFFGALFCN